MSPHSNPLFDADASRRFNHACYHGRSQEALDLLGLGADPLWRGDSGKTSLHYASMGGHASLCEFLVRRDPETLSARDGAGQTPLHLACRNARRDAALALRLAGSDLGARDDFGRMPLECCPDGALRLEIKKLDEHIKLREAADRVLPAELSCPSLSGFFL